MALSPDSRDIVRLGMAVVDTNDIAAAGITSHLFPTAATFSVQVYLRSIRLPITLLVGLSYAQAYPALDAMKQYLTGVLVLDQLVALYHELAQISLPIPPSTSMSWHQPTWYPSPIPDAVPSQPATSQPAPPVLPPLAERYRK